MNGWKHLLAIWLGGLLLASNTLADTITLKNGDKIHGDIESENDAQVFIEIRRSGGSIVTHETVPKTNIKEIERSTPEQKQEQLTYESPQTRSEPRIHRVSIRLRNQCAKRLPHCIFRFKIR
jgi:hypothetical protein